MKLKPTVCVGIIVAAAISRLVPHAPNFTPIGALALFAGAKFEGRFMPFVVPIATMLLSDAVLGFWFYRDMPAVYASFLLTVLMGRYLRRPGQDLKAASIATASVFSATVFYGLTNLSVWISSDLYSHSVTGLLTCYVMAIPFFGNTLASSLFYSLIMFGAARLADRTVLRPVTS